MRNKIVAPALAVLGLFMLFGGFSMLNNDKVTCGGKNMRNGDTCREVHRRSGHTTRRSFDQQRKDNHSTSLALLGLGSAMTIGGLVWSVVSYRKRPTAAPNYYAPPGGQAYYPPFSGQPPLPGQPPPGGQQSYPPSSGGYYPPPSSPQYYPPPSGSPPPPT